MDEHMRVVLVGGSGFLGRRLCSRLVALGHRVTVIGRGAGPDRSAGSDAESGWSHRQWDAQTLGDWTGVVDGADVVVHLTGKRVDCRPTEANIEALIASREGPVKLVGEAIRRAEVVPRRWVQLSSLAIFGDAGDEIITEATRPPTTGPRQQVEVCHRWEDAYRAASSIVDETVLLRPAITIGGAADPATRQLALLARLGLAGPVAGGDQWVSWIGVDDMIDLLVRSVVDPAARSLYHVCSPNPVTNAALMAAYRQAVGRRFGLPTPAPLAEFGAWLLGSDPALVLTGRRCVPTRLLNEGYRFKAESITDAVGQAVRDIGTHKVDGAGT